MKLDGPQTSNEMGIELWNTLWAVSSFCSTIVDVNVECRRIESPIHNGCPSGALNNECTLQGGDKTLPLEPIHYWLTG